MRKPTERTEHGTYRYWRSCVDFGHCEAYEPGGLIDMIDNSIEIKRRAFREAVNRDDLAELERQLGYSTNYARGLTISSDRLVTYHRSRFDGQRVYYLRQSAIEYIFKQQEG